MRRLVGFAVAQKGFRFARIVIAVMQEENDFSADFLLQPARGLNFCDEKTLREKPAGLLAETNDGGAHSEKDLTQRRKGAKPQPAERGQPCPRVPTSAQATRGQGCPRVACALVGT